MKYNVTIVSTRCRVVTVEADTEDYAREKAWDILLEEDDYGDLLSDSSEVAKIGD